MIQNMMPTKAEHPPGSNFYLGNLTVLGQEEPYPVSSLHTQSIWGQRLSKCIMQS